MNQQIPVFHQEIRQQMCRGGRCYIATTAIVLVPVFSVGPVRWPSAVRAGTCCLADSVVTCWRSVAHPALDCVYKHQTFKLISLKIKILCFILYTRNSCVFKKNKPNDFFFALCQTFDNFLVGVHCSIRRSFLSIDHNWKQLFRSVKISKSTNFAMNYKFLIEVLIEIHKQPLLYFFIADKCSV